MIFLIISLTTFYIYLILKSKKVIKKLEDNDYDLKKYFKSLFNPQNVFLDLELLFIVLVLIALCTNVKIIGICTILFYMFLSLKEIKEKIKIKNKRMLVVTILLFVSLSIPIIIDYDTLKNTYIFYDPTFMYYLLLYLFMYLLWFIAPVILFIDKFFKGGKKC